ncbi:MAG: biliverdin-producing heme oxygenase, partial [Gammaproteobacteria bacterium]
MNEVLTALRAATARQHAMLDAGLPLAGPHPTLDDYRDHLSMLRGWLAPIVRWLDGFDDGPRIAPTRLATIEADLALIAPLPALSGESPWPGEASTAYRWGVCYVVEGSQLGGAVLYKKLAERLAPHPLAYLKGDGNPGPAWRDFVGMMGDSVRDEADVLEACHGACEA